MNETTTTSNPLLRVRDEDLEQVLNARKTITKVAQKYGLSPQPHATQIVHRRNNNGTNGHNGHRKMSQSVRNRISASMRKRWAQRRKEAKKSEQGAPA